MSNLMRVVSFQDMFPSPTQHEGSLNGLLIINTCYGLYSHLNVTQLNTHLRFWPEIAKLCIQKTCPDKKIMIFQFVELAV